MILDRLILSIKYIGGVAVFAAVPSIFIWLIGGREYGVAFFALGFFLANAYGCYMSLRSRGVVQALVFAVVFLLIGSVLAAVIYFGPLAAGIFF